MQHLSELYKIRRKLDFNKLSPKIAGNISPILLYNFEVL